MEVNFNVKRIFIVNGKEYKSAEEMPPELREAYEKATRSSAGLKIEKPQVSVKTKIVFNDREYDSLEAMPADVRRVYQSVMKSVETGQASSDLLSAALGEESASPRLGGTFHTSGDLVKPIEPTSSVPTWIMGVLVLLGLVFLLYYLVAK